MDGLQTPTSTSASVPPGDLSHSIVGIPVEASAASAPAPAAGATTAAGESSSWGRSSISASFSSSPATPVHYQTRLISDGRGKLMFLGDSANLSFLQVIRRLVRDALGVCTFVDDPFRHHIIESSPERRSDWIASALANPPSKPSPDEGADLLHWYLRATNCILNLFDPSELSRKMKEWLQRSPGTAGDDDDDDTSSAVFFLILAIGAQTCPQDRDQLAERYFNYGRYLTVSNVMENPSLPVVSTHLLITMYLLAASRRNSAFMCLGIAVRAAYALGIHRKDIASHFTAHEVATRERLWVSLRIMDTFLSASLGRPTSTSETRDTTSPLDYSAANDICAIFDSILTDIYAKRMLRTQDLERISERHRQWTLRFPAGLGSDNVSPEEYITASDGTRQFNIGLCYVKQAYYWTIILLSRPFLVEAVRRRIAMARVSQQDEAEPPHQPSPSDQTLVHACVDSAVRTLDILRDFGSGEDAVPKRLPFIVNTVFMSALVIGVACFDDLDQSFPLEKSMNLALRILNKLGPYDTVAKRDAVIVENLYAACNVYCERRTRRKMERRGLLVGGLFGRLYEGQVGGGGEGRSTGQTVNYVAGAASLSSSSQHEGPGTPGPTETGAAATDRSDSSIIQSGSITTDGESSLYAATADNAMDHGLGIPDFRGASGATVLPISPRALTFDSFDDFMPLYSTVDASLLQIAGGGEATIPDGMLF